MRQTFRSRLFLVPPGREGAEKGAGARNSPAPFLLQRLPFSSDYHSPAPPILQRLPFSSSSHSPAPPIIRLLPFSSASHFSSAYHFSASYSSPFPSPAPSILQRLPFSSDYLSSASSTTQSNYFAHFLSPDTSFHACSQTPSLAITFLWHFSSQPGGQWLRRPEIPNLEVNGYDD